MLVSQKSTDDSSSKECANLLSIICVLFNFKVGQTPPLLSYQPSLRHPQIVHVSLVVDMLKFDDDECMQ